jgi:prolyl oligopeptidase PreP (S9A serine peptidase family)
VSDPHRWLEDGSSPRVRQWIDSQNVGTDGVLSTFAQGPALTKRAAELSATSPERTTPIIIEHHGILAITHWTVRRVRNRRRRQ